jgi:hypothetical protein
VRIKLINKLPKLICGCGRDLSITEEQIESGDRVLIIPDAIRMNTYLIIEICPDCLIEYKLTVRCIEDNTHSFRGTIQGLCQARSYERNG